MKKKIVGGGILFLVMLTMCLSFVACGANVTISVDTYAMKVGDSYTLYLSVDDEIQTEGSTWTSSDTTVATVDGTTGKVTAVGAGEVTITGENGGGEATCTITVTNKMEVVSSISGLTAFETSSTALSLTQNGTALTSGVTWTSATETVATVDASGYVKGEGAGSSVITGTTTDGDSATVTITVSAATVATSPSSISVAEGKSSDAIVMYINGVQATSSITWVSANTAVATVSSAGVVTGVAEGNTTVTGTAANGAVAVCNIEVVSTKVELSSTDTYYTTIKSGDELEFELPAGVTADAWASSDTSIATVDGGVVTTTGIMETTTITATVGSDTYTAAVTVVPTSAIKEVGTTTVEELGSDYTPGEFYAYSDSSSFQLDDVELVNGKMTMTFDSSFSDMQQLRFLPANPDGTEFVGTYSIVYTVTNNTNDDTTFKSNRNGETTSIISYTTIAAGDTETIVFSCNSTDASQQMNIKIGEAGEGTVVLSDFYFLLDGCQTVVDTDSQESLAQNIVGTGAASQTPGDWFLTNITDATATVVDGVVTFTRGANWNNINRGIGYLPQDADGNTYVGRINVTWTVNHTSSGSATVGLANYNTASLSNNSYVSIGTAEANTETTFSTTWLTTSAKPSINIIFKNSNGGGVYTISDISFVLLDAYVA